MLLFNFCLEFTSDYDNILVLSLSDKVHKTVSQSLSKFPPSHKPYETYFIVDLILWVDSHVGTNHLQPEDFMTKKYNKKILT